MTSVDVPPPAGVTYPIETALGLELARLLSSCRGLLGAALASRDGLALATSGVLHAEIMSATAAFLLGQVDSHLTLLRSGRALELLVWTDAGPWYFSAIAELPYLIALQATPEMPAALLRHIGALAGARMTNLLATLEEQ